MGQGLFQFQFANEQDLLKALENQPFHFSRWMVILQRWEPTLEKSFPSHIPFWIHVQGIPVHLWSEEILISIAESIGHLEQTEITPTYFRMRVTINGLRPLTLVSIMVFENGSELEATLVYDKLLKYCKLCQMLDHEQKDCLSNPRSRDEMWTPEATPELILGLKCPQEDMSIQIDVRKFPRPEEKKIPGVEQVAITSLSENL